MFNLYLQTDLYNSLYIIIVIEYNAYIIKTGRQIIPKTININASVPIIDKQNIPNKRDIIKIGIFRMLFIILF